MKEKPFIIYFLTQSLFLGFGISILFSISSKDCYIGALLGLLIGFVIIYLYSKFLELKKKRTLKEILKQNKILGIFVYLLIIIASYILLIYSLVIYKVFVASFMLIKTPEILLLIPIVIFGTYGAFKGLTVINRVAESLIPLALGLAAFAFLGVVGLFDTSNFLPILTTTPSNFFKTAITFAGISTFPNLLTIHYQEKPKYMLTTYSLTCLLIIGTIIYINGILGEELVHIYRFPEYMVLKQLKLFQFIEKVENILSIAWIFNIFILLMTSIHSIKELLPNKKPKIITVIILILTLYMIDKVFAFNYVNELRIYKLLPYISIIIPLIIIIPLLYLAKKKKSNHN
jgi:spore germination protein KB